MFPTERHFKIHFSKRPKCTTALRELHKNTLAESNDKPDEAPNENAGVDNDNSSVSFDMNTALDDAKDSWPCLEPWDSTSKEENSNGLMEDAKLLVNDATTVSTTNTLIPSTIVTVDGLCFTQSDYVETKSLKMLMHHTFYTKIF